MTLHHENDEDWIYFDADDDLFDNVNVRVDVGSFPAAGSYVVELYLDDTLKDTAVGSGRLSVQFSGSWTSTGEDDFWIRVYSDSWLASDCDRRYTVDITET